MDSKHFSRLKKEPSRDFPSQTRWQPPAGCPTDPEIGSAQ